MQWKTMHLLKNEAKNWRYWPKQISCDDNNSTIIVTCIMIHEQDEKVWRL